MRESMEGKRDRGIGTLSSTTLGFSEEGDEEIKVSLTGLPISFDGLGSIFHKPAQHSKIGEFLFLFLFLFIFVFINYYYYNDQSRVYMKLMGSLITN